MPRLARMADVAADIGRRLELTAGRDRWTTAHPQQAEASRWLTGDECDGESHGYMRLLGPVPSRS